jgi:hypothetical protein
VHPSEVDLDDPTFDDCLALLLNATRGYLASLVEAQGPA